MGRNVLGRLLMELRAEMSPHVDGAPFRVEPRFPRAVLLGKELLVEEMSPLSDPRMDPG